MHDSGMLPPGFPIPQLGWQGHISSLDMAIIYDCCRHWRPMNIAIEIDAQMVWIDGDERGGGSQADSPRRKRDDMVWYEMDYLYLLR